MSDRSSLGFSDAVHSAFGFVVKEYGYRCTRSEDTLVRYESDGVILIVYHGRSSYEVEIEINNRAADARGETPYYLSDLLLYCGRGDELPQGVLQASTPEAVKWAVDRLADFVRECGDPLLRGEAFAFQRMRTLVSEEAVSAGKQRRLDDLRAEAKRAWEQADYARVVALYSSIEADLKPSERKRLELARMRSS